MKFQLFFACAVMCLVAAVLLLGPVK